MTIISTRISYAIYIIWLIPPASFVFWTTVLVSPVGWKWLWQCCHSHHMRLRKWLWSFRDRFFSRFRLAPAVSWFCRFFWKIEITKQRHANSGRFQCLRTTKKMNYINHKTKKIAFLWFPRCSFLLFNRIRMSNLNFRVIPVFFVIFSVWKHHFSTTKKKLRVRRKWQTWREFDRATELHPASWYSSNPTC